MNQNRNPPAYQEYAATILSDKNFRLMTLEERGLLYTMRLECWANLELPSDEVELAKYLSFNPADVQKALSPRVKSFFDVKNGMYFSPELENYRNHLNERKEKQSQGGRRGANITNGKPIKSTNKAHTSNSGKSSGIFQLPRQGARESLVQLKPVKPSQDQLLKNNNKHSQWLDDLERTSNGG